MGGDGVFEAESGEDILQATEKVLLQRQTVRFNNAQVSREFFNIRHDTIDQFLNAAVGSLGVRFPFGVQHLPTFCKICESLSIGAGSKYKVLLRLEEFLTDEVHLGGRLGS